MTASQIVKVGLVQMRAESDPDKNLEKALSKVREAADQGAQVVCLQELFRSVYFCQKQDARNFDLAEAIPSRTTDVLSELAREKGIVIVAPVFEKRAEGVYHNSAVVIDADGKLLGTYRKMHIPDDPCFNEKYYFTPGDTGFTVFETRFGRIAVLICWDQWFPEAARLAALGGAQILFYPTAIGWHEEEAEGVPASQMTGWEVVQRGHAVANELYVAVVNRVGKEGPIHFWGRSFVSNPFGEVLGLASQDKEENLIVSCDLSKIEEFRQNWPFLRDRRIDAYGPLSSRFIDQPSKLT